MKEATRSHAQTRTVIMPVLLPILLLLSLNACNQAECCSNFQGIRLCEFDTPDSYGTWEEYRTHLQGQGYACQ